MRVKNSADLRVAYEILNTYKELISEHGKTERVEKRIAEQKREIRKFHKKISDRRLVKDDGMDGYVLLIELPETLKSMQDAVEYFKLHEVICAVPSIFDCTGQAFTAAFKVFERRGKFMAYHAVRFDV